jgi:hypothetical protein
MFLAKIIKYFESVLNVPSIKTQNKKYIKYNKPNILVTSQAQKFPCVKLHFQDWSTFLITSHYKIAFFQSWHVYKLFGEKYFHTEFPGNRKFPLRVYRVSNCWKTIFTIIMLSILYAVWLSNIQIKAQNWHQNVHQVTQLRRSKTVTHASFHF